MKTPPPASEQLREALADTSVIIDLQQLLPRLPQRIAVSSITLAELSVGPLVAKSHGERAARQEHLQAVEAAFEPVLFTPQTARIYGRVYAAVVEAGRNPRRRIADLLIAATAIAEELPLITRNADDFLGLEDLLQVVEI